jgi:hypothetical protein
MLAMCVISSLVKRVFLQGITAYIVVNAVMCLKFVISHSVI